MPQHVRIARASDATTAVHGGRPPVDDPGTPLVLLLLVGHRLQVAVDVEVAQAVREVAGGGRYLHPALGARLIAAAVEAKAREQADLLSEREREVMRLLALGYTNQEIAKLLHISVRTAETHRAHIMKKLHLSTRAELVRNAIEQRLLHEEEGQA